MIETIRETVGTDPDDAKDDEVAEVTPDDAASIITKLSPGTVRQFVDAALARFLRQDIERAVAAVMRAFKSYYQQQGSRSDRLIEAEERAFRALRDASDDRLDELAEEREAAAKRGVWAWEVDAPALTDHPDEDGLRDALDAVYSRLKAADDGLTDEELAAAFQDAYRGPLKYRTPRVVWQRWLPILADAPGVTLVDAGVWSLDGDPLDDDELADAIEDAVPSGVADRLPLATIYDRIADEGTPTPTAYLVAALNAFTDDDREVWETESVAAGMTIPEAIAVLPGVEPPAEDAPMLHHTDDAEGADE